MVSDQLPTPTVRGSTRIRTSGSGAARLPRQRSPFDASQGSTTTRRATIQVVCGRGWSGQPSPHKTVFIKSGEIRSATARCPKGQQLVTGGFQRTNFGIDGGGNYVTESRAVGTRAWRVSGSAFPPGGGELTAIAYCVKHKRPFLTEVSASAPVVPGQSATATTPPCPAGRRLTTTGFSTDGSPQCLLRRQLAERRRPRRRRSSATSARRRA
jgi:hypothetical protein